MEFYTVDSYEATNSYKFIVPHLNLKPLVHTTHLYRILFTTHTYLTFAFFLHQHSRQDSHGSALG